MKTKIWSETEQMWKITKYYRLFWRVYLSKLMLRNKDQVTITTKYKLSYAK